MRIAMVSEHASPLAVLGGVDAGGQNVHVAALARALAAAGDEVVVHTRRDDPGLPRTVRMARGVVVDHVDAGPARALPKDALLPYMAALGDGLRVAWEEDPPDVVHTHFWMSAVAALEPAAERGIPLVHTFHALGVVKRRHQGAQDTSPAERLALEQEIARRADHIVATCTDEVFELVRLGVDRRRMTVIPSGVQLAAITPEGPVEPRTPGRHRLVAACRLVERKGLADAVRALALLPRTELHVAGGPPLEAIDADPEARRLRALARELGVGDRLVLRGRIDRAAMPALLRSADVVVCVPWYEPFGIVPLEAMAAGVAVVASAVGGHVDTVVDGETGVLVLPRDPVALAAALGPLLGSAEERRRLGAAGRRRAEARYGFDRIAAATRGVYAALAAPVAHAGERTA
jgi:glycosyltransferase involved in cell wall biosynthesis